MQESHAVRITLLTVLSDVPVGGLMAVYEYANRLAGRGHQVTLLHGWPRTAVARALSFPPQPPGRPPLAWHAIDPRVTVRYVAEHRLDALPDSDVIADVGCAFHDDEIAARLPRFGVAVELILGERIVSKENEQRWLRVRSKKICVGSWLLDYLRDRNVPEDEMVFVPLGFEPRIFRVSSPVEGRPPRVAMLFNDSFPKGSEVGLAALERIRAAVPQAAAVLFGTGERPHQLPHWIDYHWLPSRTELAEAVYNSAAIYLCPSRSEGFHLCAAEAMACGCALVSTDIRGVHDYAEHEVTALLSSVNVPEALAGNALRLLHDPVLRWRIAHAGAARVAQYAWDRSIDLIERHFEQWHAQSCR